jgi:hypothetical protein
MLLAAIAVSVIPPIRLPKPPNCKILDNVILSEKNIFHVYVCRFLNVTFSKLFKKIEINVLTVFLVSQSVVTNNRFLHPPFHLNIGKRDFFETQQNNVPLFRKDQIGV